MGCGNSKLAPEGEALPPIIRPLLRHRFLEMRKRRSTDVLKKGGLSKKNLLKDGEDEDDSHSSGPHSEIVDGKSSSSSPEKKEKSPEKPEGTEKAIEDLKEQDTKEDKENVKGGEKDKLVTGAESTEKMVAGDEDDGDNDDEYETGDEDDRFICPGSPSFRVYFLDAVENEKKEHAEEEEDDKEENSPRKKTQSNESFDSHESESSNVAEERKRSKKGTRGSAFRRAIKKGGPVAVKNLLNVKSCYHPGRTSGTVHDRATLLGSKAAAA